MRTLSCKMYMLIAVDNTFGWSIAFSAEHTSAEWVMNFLG